MAKENTIIWIVVAVAIVAFIGFSGTGMFAITGSETMTRTSSISEVSPSGTFQVTYTAVGASGTWGASIVDSVTGGCKFPDGSTELKTVMLSADGNTKTVTLTAPSSSGACTFTGDYKYGTVAEKDFSALSVDVKTCNTEADTNCDGVVDRDELGVSITQWISGAVARTKLGEIIVAWIESN